MTPARIAHDQPPVSMRQRSQAALEFMLVLPAFFAVILLVVDFGLVMYEFVSVANAAREGARYGALGCPGVSTGCSPSGGVSPIEAWTYNRSGGILTSSDQYTIWVCLAETTGVPQYGSVNETVKHTYHFLFIPSAQWTVTSTASMMIEPSSSTLYTGLTQDAYGTASCPTS